MMLRRTTAVLAASLLSLPLLASDWPQWRGPDRTDLSKETGLLKSWPGKGPRLLWTCTEAGVGYSGPAVVGDRLYSMGGEGKSEFVFVLDVRTGKRLWNTEIGALFTEGHGDGPRATPTFEDGRLYALGGRGDLACLDAKTGKKLWAINLRKDLGGEMMSGWGYTESPLIDGQHVICTPGGDRGTLAALDKLTGKVVWRSTDLKDRAAYSSAVVAEVGGVRQYIQSTGKAVVGVAAQNGKLLWRTEEPAFKTAVIPTPIFHDSHVFATAGYGAGCDLIHLTPDGQSVKAEQVYGKEVKKNMVNHHGGVVLVGDDLYGYSDGKGWVCQDFKSGKIRWSNKSLGKGSVTFADGCLYCYSEDDGKVALVEASSAEWRELGRFKIPQESPLRKSAGKTWTHPVVANGRLYIRDQNLMFCFDVRATN
jgi:outer membrane protein assembly factor BamB